VSRVSGRGLGAVHLAAHRRGDALASSADPNARLMLRSDHRGEESYGLSIDWVDVGIPSACQALPAGYALDTRHFELTNPLRLSDGSKRLPVRWRELWRCVCDRAGAISELRPVSPPSLHLRPGLGVSLVGPRAVTAGATVTYRVRLRNLRRGLSESLVAALWHLVAQGAASVVPVRGERKSGRALVHASWRIRELRPAKSMVLRLRVRVPVSSAVRLCVAAMAGADAARAASARLCARISPPPLGGLG
jgi:hypothetical protein